MRRHLAVDDLCGDGPAGLDQPPQRQRRDAQRVQVSVRAEHLLQELRQPRRLDRPCRLPHLSSHADYHQLSAQPG